MNPHKGQVLERRLQAIKDQTKAILLSKDIADAVEYYKKETGCEYSEAIRVVTVIETQHFKTTRDPIYPSR